MSAITKIRKEEVDDRHHIRDPLERSSPEDVRIWANTLKKTRICTLFYTQSGLPGHLKILQCELNRITPEKLNGSPPQVVEAAYEENRSLRTAMAKAVKAAKDAKFPLPGLHLHIPLLNDLIII